MSHLGSIHCFAFSPSPLPRIILLTMRTSASAHKNACSTDTSPSNDGQPSNSDDEQVSTYFNMATKGSNAFRILLVGKSGSGKSTLVKEVFDFDVTGDHVHHFSVCVPSLPTEHCSILCSGILNFYRLASTTLTSQSYPQITKR